MRPLFGTGFLIAKYWYFYLRLYYIRKEQDSFRTEMYKGSMGYVHNKAANSVIGKMVILPSSFMESPRATQQNLLDLMTICQNFGKLDLFLTMTYNPHWKEIAENIYENKNAIDRPDIISRVFHSKINISKVELLKKNIFGKVIAFISLCYKNEGYCIFTCCFIYRIMMNYSILSYLIV